MFDLFGYGKQIQEMDESVSQSFSKVKKDTDALYQWVAYLHQQNQQLQEHNSVLRRLVDEQKLSLHELRVALQHVPKTAGEIRQLVDAHYNVEPILQRIRHIEQKIDAVELRSQQRAHVLGHPLVEKHPSASAESERKEVPVSSREESRAAIKEKLARKLARNSKEYIKNLALSLVHKYGRIGALQMREIIVEEQGLCSKSSFYRILEEMEREHLLQVVSDGKHTIYVASAKHERHA
ncbi:hypothetical protein C4580_01585 [Candidatus Woesearchaeota archaeon]|nr:MAG: hypothetical protein C4580_01585 [Candidatus Woesearchaeota archaeon]